MKFGLLGFPVKHSISPWIHEQFMKKTGIAGTYELFETRPESLEERIKSWRKEEIDGFNVTIPFKQDIVPFLDKVEEEAKQIGAVNTVVNQNGEWKGYNTDGRGYYRSLVGSFPDLVPELSSVLLIGAGGAARGIYHVLVREGFQRVDITNRTLEKASRLVREEDENKKTTVLSLKQAEGNLSNYDVVIQTTSVGMEPSTEEIPISLDNLKRGTIVSDIVYKPLTTRFLTEGKKRGGVIHQGHAMLLYQAQYAFEIWTGKEAPLDSVLQQLEYRLRGN